MSDDYECTLDEECLKVAREELHENPSDRLMHVEALRTWLMQQPHLTAHTDTKSLLPFLRTAKYNLVKAQQMIENSLALKTEVPDWFSDIDMHDAKMRKFLSTGYITRLPHRLNGQNVLLFRLGCLDLSNKHYDKATIMRGIRAITYYFLLEEMTQVYGLVLLLDFTSVPSGLLNTFNLEDIKNIAKMWEDTFPGEIKGFHYYNTGPTFEAFMAISKPLLSKKMQAMIHTHGYNLESVYKVFPKEMLPDEYLPDDYTGPSAGPCQALVDKLTEELTSEEFRNHFLEHSAEHWGVNESKRPRKVPQ